MQTSTSKKNKVN